MCTPGTIADSQTEVAKINKNCCCFQTKNLSGSRDTIMHWKTFRVISNETPVLLTILSWCYFSYLKMYSDEFFDVYFYEQMFFEMFEAKGDTG